MKKFGNHSSKDSNSFRSEYYSVAQMFSCGLCLCQSPSVSRPAAQPEGFTAGGKPSARNQERPAHCRWHTENQLTNGCKWIAHDKDSTGMRGAGSVLAQWQGETSPQAGLLCVTVTSTDILALSHSRFNTSVCFSIYLVFLKWINGYLMGSWRFPDSAVVSCSAHWASEERTLHIRC